MSNQRHTNAWRLVPLVGLLLLGAALVWHDLGTREVLGRDENATITTLDQPNLCSVLHATTLKLTGQPGCAQPLYFLIQSAFWPVVGRSAFVFRFLPSVFGLLTILLTFKLGEALFGREAGLVGAFLTSLLPFHLEYAQIARPYPLLTTCSLASAYFLIRALKTERLWYWLGLVLAATLSFYTHFSALSVLASEALLTGIVSLVQLQSARRQGRVYFRLVKPVCAFLVVGLLCLPGLIRLAPFVGEGGGGKIRVEFTIPFFAQFLYGIGLTGAGSRGLVLGFMAVGLLATLYRRKWWAALFVVLWLSLPFVVLAFVKAPRPFYPRYVIFVTPVAFLLAGEGIASVARLAGRLRRRGEPKRVRQTALLVLAVGLAIFFVLPLQVYYSVNRQADRLDQTLQVLEHHVQPEDLVIVSPRVLVCPLDARGAQVLYLSDHLAPSEFEELLSRFPRVWVLYTSYLPPAELQEPLDQWIQAREEEFVRVSIKAITSLAYSNRALTDRQAILTDRIAVLKDLAAVSVGQVGAWLPYGVLADAYDDLADLYVSQGKSTLANEARQQAIEARETAPRIR
jgi:4-amino-4-deoxy-L-arabinose transferase-like glycosyltransferase